MLYSILSLFAYRHQCVLPDSHKLKMTTKTFVMFISFLNLFALVYMVPFLLWGPDQSVSIENLRRSFIDPPCDLWEPHMYVFLDGSDNRLLYCYFVALFIISSSMIFLVFHSFYSIKKESKTTSRCSQRRQLGFLYALILMALVPNTFLVFPVFGLIVGSVNSMSYNSALGEILVCSLSVHGILSTLTLILSHKPYRSEATRVMRKLTCRNPDPKKSNAQVEFSTRSVKY
ncbi:hypothetical protein CRE_27253 [Caenorhabditis remanei]|uniref:G-protein coupled receptors family 1 profile domain-containing protein n=1 Tax=Caenorhabditis remanei TaxID=31234 RepID=E3LPA7_CAERE|nr:hypothetical protein CRE_27253 [Caenorhabditis remanei]